MLMLLSPGNDRKLPYRCCTSTPHHTSLLYLGAGNPIHSHLRWVATAMNTICPSDQCLMVLSCCQVVSLVKRKSSSC
ncbi:hypothetical protein CHARACLAT_002045 [Characodon lateralis]|uniref:Uncharacterized protein n=1 Tax=Characodon lateralis TaxID=208331 RepID=A0ABU7EZL3_9TELE|nr:hypothetical protein [Characodon lateralis]